MATIVPPHIPIFQDERAVLDLLYNGCKPYVRDFTLRYDVEGTAVEGVGDLIDIPLIKLPASTPLAGGNGCWALYLHTLPTTHYESNDTLVFRPYTASACSICSNASPLIDQVVTPAVGTLDNYISFGSYDSEWNAPNRLGNYTIINRVFQPAATAAQAGPYTTSIVMSGHFTMMANTKV